MSDQVLYDIKASDADHEEFHCFSGGDRWLASGGENNGAYWAPNVGGPQGDGWLHSSHANGGAPPFHALAYGTRFKVRARVKGAGTCVVKAIRYDDTISTYGYQEGDLAAGDSSGNYEWIETGWLDNDNSGTPYVGVSVRFVSELTEYQIIIDAVAPNAPVLNAVAQVGGANSLSVSWPAVTGADSYKLYRDTSTNPTTEISANAVSPYVDAGLTPGTTYYYRAKAVNGGGDSAYSNNVSAEVDTEPSEGPSPGLRNAVRTGLVSD
jgi:fibronectin type III domain protein